MIMKNEITTLKAWARIVARAAPAEPSLKTATKSKSAKMFAIQAIITVIKGVFESPIPLKIAPKRL